MANGNDDPVIEHPTWLGDIRYFFDQGDIDCMKPRGLDLSSYADVKSHGYNIYMQVQSGQMPMGQARWSANKVQSLLNWIQQNYPMGSESGRAATALAAMAPPERVRKNIASLSSGEIDQLTAAFTELMKRDPTDPTSYYSVASQHGVPLLYCMHHVQPFASWHRLYLQMFEDTLRTVEGCSDLTLPYWDVTTQAPDFLFQPPFASYTVPVPLQGYGDHYTTQRYDAATIYSKYQIAPSLEWSIGQAVVQPNFGQSFSHGFDSFYVQAHDNGHDRAGPTLSDPNVASFDPIFWFFHANWDRVWLSWQRIANALTIPTFTATLDKDDNPIWLTFPLAPWTGTSDDTISMPEIGYDAYIEAPAMPNVKSGNVEAMSTFAVAPDAKVSVRVKGIDRTNIPGTFAVLLLADGEQIARQAFFQPPVPNDCPTCSKQPLVNIDFQVDQSELAGKSLSVAIDVPSLGEGAMGRFPLSQVGNPTINARLLLEER